MSISSEEANFRFSKKMLNEDTLVRFGEKETCSLFLVFHFFFVGGSVELIVIILVSSRFLIFASQNKCEWLKNCCLDKKSVCFFSHQLAYSYLSVW